MIVVPRLWVLWSRGESHALCARAGFRKPVTEAYIEECYSVALTAVGTILSKEGVNKNGTGIKLQ